MNIAKSQPGKVCIWELLWCIMCRGPSSQYLNPIGGRNRDSGNSLHSLHCYIIITRPTFEIFLISATCFYNDATFNGSFSGKLQTVV